MQLTNLIPALLATIATVAADDSAAGADGKLRIGVKKTVPANLCTRKTKSGDRLSMQYRGSLASDGSEFDSSYKRNTPFQFTLGSGQVIKGWDQGLLDMCVGEQRKLTIPPNLGYGDRGMGPIPAGSTLIFDVELVGIDGYTPPTAAEAESPEAEAEAEADPKVATPGDAKEEAAEAAAEPKPAAKAAGGGQKVEL